jgi:hypothetical protein
MNFFFLAEEANSSADLDSDASALQVFAYIHASPIHA